MTPLFGGLYLTLTFFAIVAIFVVFFVSVAFFEKQHVCDLVPADGRAISTAPYFNAMNDDAAKLGFIPAGVFVQDRKSKLYQACVAFWISPDGYTLLRIGGGTTAGIEIKRSVLATFIEPEKIIETTDEAGSADLSGLTDRKLVLNAHLEELVRRHNERLQRIEGARRVFTPDQALTAFATMQAMRANRLEALGFARSVNRERTIWRYTFKGAWLLQTKGMYKQLEEADRQEDRVRLKRPGHK